MSTLYSKKWTDKNGQVRYYRDEEARNSITTLNGNSSVSGSVDNKIATALADFGGFQVVASLSDVTNPNTHTIYLVKDTSVTGSDKYKEYIYVNNNFEMIGDTSIDLSGYVQTSDIGTAAAADTTTTITSGGTDVPTDGAVYTALSSIVTSTTADPGEGSALATGHLLVVLSE